MCVAMVMAAFAMTATLPGRTHGLGLITQPLTNDPSLGIGSVLFSTLNFWAIILGSAICLPIAMMRLESVNRNARSLAGTAGQSMRTCKASKCESLSLRDALLAAGTSHL